LALNPARAARSHLVVALLDTNCLIDLEKGTGQAADLEQLVEAHRRGRIELVAAAITASEKEPPGTPRSFELLTSRLERLNLSEVRILPPMGRWDEMYWGQALWADEEMQALEERIRAVIAPNFDLDHTSNRRKWLNTLCDIQMVFTHLWHKTDLLITGDERHLLRRAAALAELGAKVVSPAQAAELLPNDDHSDRS
jgi:hypothetical protein